MSSENKENNNNPQPLNVVGRRPLKFANKWDDAKVRQIFNLRDMGKTIREIHEITGVPIPTINQKLRSRKHQKEVKEISETSFKKAKADVFEEIQYKIVKTLSEEEIKQMKPKEKIQALTILNDQVRRERGLDDKDNVTINVALLNDAYERAVSMLDMTKIDFTKYRQGAIARTQQRDLEKSVINTSAIPLEDDDE